MRRRNDILEKKECDTVKIWTLMENTAAEETFCAEHGLSFYMETKKHKILFDAGQTDAFAENAKKLGIDLSQVDVAVLSHGHYDHGGGLLKFLELNEKAPVYVSPGAFGAHYNGTEKYIGLSDKLADNPRLIAAHMQGEKGTGKGHSLRLDEELTLYSCNERPRTFPTDSAGLKIKQNGVFRADDFLHEQYLLVEEEGKRVLFSGCSHKGILNIADWFRPDVLIGGFHFMKLDVAKDAELLAEAANRLLSYPTRYFTGHCTGLAQYEFLREKMGDRISYLSAGSCLEI